MSFRFDERFDNAKPSINFIDYSDLLLFTKDDLEKALSKLPCLRLMPDNSFSQTT